MTAPTYNDGYKAIVCIFFNGGNQSYNWIVPNDYTEDATRTSTIVKGTAYKITNVGSMDWNSVAGANSWIVSTTTSTGVPVVGSTFNAAVSTTLVNGGIVVKLYDGPKYTEYNTARRGNYSSDPNVSGGLAIPRPQLHPLNGVASDGYPYGIHPSCPDIAAIFNDGDGAVICNVGTLITATTKTQVLNGTAQYPPQLFSHIDQQTQWQRGICNALLKSGWGGRVSDLYFKAVDDGGAGITPQLKFSLSPSEKSIFLSGETTTQYITGTSATPPEIGSLTNGWRGGTRAAADAEILGQALTSSNPLTKSYAQVRQSADTKLSIIKTALSKASLTAQFPTNSSLAEQLKQVARIIKSNVAAGVNGTLTDQRQLFFNVQYGFDGHDYEYESQIKLLKEFNDSVKGLVTEIKNAGLWNNVVIFTNSEFARSIAPNYDGSDHAWGGHSMVFGGSVVGGYYGTMPSLVIGGADDINNAPYANGRIIPTTATEQYSATLAKWLGVSEADLLEIFPNLKNFSPTTLSFLG